MWIPAGHDKGRRLALAGSLVLLLVGPTARAADRQAEIRLGAQLFYDVRLSADNDLSCASCHRPELAFTDGLAQAKGKSGKRLRRNTPTLLHVADQTSFFWDGRARSLENQVLHPIQSAEEMGSDLDHLVAEIAAIAGYQEQFQAIYRGGATAERIARAVAAFERTLVSRGAPFDRYLTGEPEALSESARRGVKLFQGPARCAHCHKGLNFTNSDFHNLGVPEIPGQPPDLGRFEVTGDPKDRGAFKTPTLRNVALTAPYMHNGVFQTLAQVMEFYNQGGNRNANLDILMEPLNLDQQEISDLVAFLESLTGRLPVIQPPALP